MPDCSSTSSAGEASRESSEKTLPVSAYLPEYIQQNADQARNNLADQSRESGSKPARLETPKGTPHIVVELARAIRRNRAGTNPNQSKPRIEFDFKANRVRIAEVA